MLIWELHSVCICTRQSSIAAQAYCCNQGLSGTLYPAFSLYNKGDALTLMPAKYSASCASCGGAAAVSSVRALVRSAQLLESLVFQYQRDGTADHTTKLWGKTSTSQLRLSVCAILDFERDLKLWHEKKLLRCRSRQRELLKIDCRDSVCDLFGLGPGTCVRTSRGIACVVGAANGFLWYRLEGDQVYLPSPITPSQRQNKYYPTLQNVSFVRYFPN